MLTDQQLEKLANTDDILGFDTVSHCGGPFGYLKHGTTLSELALYASTEVHAARVGKKHDDFHCGKMLVTLLERTFPSASDEDKCKRIFYDIPFRMYHELLAANGRQMELDGKGARVLYDNTRRLILDVKEDLADALSHTLELPATTQKPVDAYTRLHRFFLSYAKLAEHYTDYTRVRHIA